MNFFTFIKESLITQFVILKNSFNYARRLILTLILTLTLSFNFINLTNVSVLADPTTTQLDIIITKLNDGSAPFDLNNSAGNDSAALNGRVRAGQNVSYKIDLSLNDPIATTPTPYSNVTFITTPLAIGFKWDSLPLLCSGSGSAITGDGVSSQSVLVCNTGTHSTGDAWSVATNIRALPTLTDGSSVQFSATVSADVTPNIASANSDITVGTSLPKVDIQKTGGGWRGTTTVDGVAGGIWTYGIGLKLKPGSEVPAIPITLTDSLANIHPSAKLYGCSLNFGNYNSTTNLGYTGQLPAGKIGIYGGTSTSTPEKAVYDSGNIDCTPSSGNPQIININLSGVNANPPSYPKYNWDNGNISGDNWIGAYTIGVFVPYSVFNSGNGYSITGTNELNDFSPVGAISGRQNFGDPALEPGRDLNNIDTAAQSLLTGTENDFRQIFYRPSPGGYDKTDYKYVDYLNAFTPKNGDLMSGVMWGSSIGSYYRSGDGVIGAGGDYTSINSLSLDGIIDIPAGFNSCVKIDNIHSTVAPLSIDSTKAGFIYAGNSDVLQNKAGWRIEYGTGGVNGVGTNWASESDQRDANCADNQSSTWYTDINAVPGGSENITKVRAITTDVYTVSEQLVDIGTSSNILLYFGVHLKIKNNAPLGTFVPNYGNFYDSTGVWFANGTNGGWSGSTYDKTAGTGFYGDRALVVGTKVRVAKTVSNFTTESLNTITGTENTWYLAPTSDSLGLPQAPLSVNTKMEDTLPADLTYVNNSAVCLDALPAVQPATCEPVVTVDSSGNQVLKWDFETFTSGQTMTRISFKTLSSTTIATGESRTNTVVVSADNDNSPAVWRTDSASVQFTNPAAFSVNKNVPNQLIEPGQNLVYKLTYRNTGSTPVGTSDFIDWLPWNGDTRNPASNFTGSTQLLSLVKDSGVNANVTYTKHNPATISLPADLEPNTINPSIVWCSESNFGLAGCPANLSEVTGFRLTGGTMLAGELSKWTTTIKTIGNGKGDVYTNRFKGRVDTLALSVESNNVPIYVVQGSIGDYVWYDSNNDGIQQVTEDPASGITVNLLDSSNNVITSVQTDLNGKYLFPNLASGNYKVKFNAPSGYTYSAKNAGSSSVDSDADISTGITNVITLGVGQNLTNIDSGFVGNEPNISIVKKINGDDANSAPGILVTEGSIMNITFEVTNTGNTVLNSILVTDDKIATSAINCPKASLLANEQMTCTATFPAPEEGVQHTNTGSVNANSWVLPGQTASATVSDTDTANATTSIIVVPAPDIKITTYINNDDANTSPGISLDPSKPMSITFVVKNTGNVTLDNVSVVDSVIANSSILCPKTTLAADEEMTCTATSIAPLAGTIHSNIATAYGTPIPTPSDLNPAQISDTDPAFANGINPSISIVKKINGDDANTAPGVSVVAGSNMNITFEVTNTGNTTLNSIVVTDDKIATSAINCPKVSLLANEQMICTASLLAPATNIQHTNTGSVVATPPIQANGQPNNVGSSNVAYAYSPSTPSIQIINKINEQDANTAPGAIVNPVVSTNITFEVTNTGNVELNNVLVTNDLIAGSNINCAKTTLLAGETMICTSTYISPAAGLLHTNTATVKATPIPTPAIPSPNDVTDSDVANMSGAAPDFTIVKKINGQDANTAPGVMVNPANNMNITFEVTNTGNTELNPVVVTDDKIATSSINCPSTRLLAGNSMICTASLAAPGGETQHTNTASVEVTPKLTDGTSLTKITKIDSANAISARPSLEVIKKINGQDANTAPGVIVKAGSDLVIEVTIKNTGNTELTTIQYTDSLIPSILFDCGTVPATLMPNETVTCSTTISAPDSGIQHTNLFTATAIPQINGETSLPLISESDTANALSYITAKIGDTVWIDTNTDGIMQISENGLSGVVVKLVDENGNPAVDDDGLLVSAQTTDTNGNYKFENLKPASYRVIFDKPTNYFNSTLNCVGLICSSSLTTLSSGDNIITVDLGLYEVASVGDRVWVDTDGNGVQNSSEDPLSGVEVKLLDASGNPAIDVNGNLVAPTTTNTNGNYKFENLRPAIYIVQFTKPSQYGFTINNPSNVAGNSDADVSGKSGTITLVSGQNEINIDAGLVMVSSLGDKVWNDLNGNGIQDNGENGLSGLTVKLTDTLGNPVTNITYATVLPTITDANGNYKFENLMPGSYKVEFSKPAGSVFTSQQLGSDSAIDSNVIISTGITQTINLVSGQNDLTVDAGIILPASIGDKVWIDTNGNGVEDSGELPFSNVSVTLVSNEGSPVIDILGNPVLPQLTNTDGNYKFENLRPGSYKVEFTKPVYYKNSNLNCHDVTINPEVTEKVCSTTLISLTSGLQYLTADLGLYVPASVGDKVWLDVNGNGIQDEDEDGIAGITVKLVDSIGNTVLNADGNLVNPVTTDTNGNYKFENLKPGTYKVEFTKPSNMVFTLMGANNNISSDNTDSNTLSNGNSNLFILSGGDNNLTLDSGLYIPVKIGDKVWNDLNANGLQDNGENGISGVTVKLTDTLGNPVLDANGNPVLPIITDVNGIYQFTNLKPGTYKVEFIKPADSYNSTLTCGEPVVPNLELASAPQPCYSSIIPTVSGDDITNIDLGLYTLGSIGDKVWIDANGNGLQEVSELPVEGVTVNLYDGAGVFIKSTITDENGIYKFENLVPANYGIGFVRPTGFYFTTSIASSTTLIADTNSDISSQIANIGYTTNLQLSSGQNITNVDAGIFVPASIGDKAWNDVNRNGVQDEGEAGMSGVTVTITDENSNPVYNINGELVIPITTDTNGNYKFENLKPGNYIVNFQTPNNYFITPKGAGSLSDSDVNSNNVVAASASTVLIALGSGQNSIVFDAGYSVKGVDSDNDGTFDEDEYIQGTNPFVFNEIPVELSLDDPYICGGGEIFGKVNYNRSYSLISVSSVLQLGNEAPFTLSGSIIDGSGNFKVPIDYNNVKSGKYKIITIAKDIYGNEARFNYEADIRRIEECPKADLVKPQKPIITVRSGSSVRSNIILNVTIMVLCLLLGSFVLIGKK